MGYKNMLENKAEIENLMFEFNNNIDRVIEELKLRDISVTKEDFDMFYRNGVLDIEETQFKDLYNKITKIYFSGFTTFKFDMRKNGSRPISIRLEKSIFDKIQFIQSLTQLSYNEIINIALKTFLEKRLNISEENIKQFNETVNKKEKVQE